MDVAWHQRGADGSSRGELCAGPLIPATNKSFGIDTALLPYFLAGAALPAIALFAARRSRWVVLVSTAWMLTLLLAFAWFAMMSGGGV
jgi:hypothetical protein